MFCLVNKTLNAVYGSYRLWQAVLTCILYKYIHATFTFLNTSNLIVTSSLSAQLVTSRSNYLLNTIRPTYFVTQIAYVCH